MLVVLCAAGVAAGVNAGPQHPSPEIGSDRRVTFRFRATDAVRVEVTFAPSPSELVRGAGTTLPMRLRDGLWTATTAPLAPDIYAYHFTVDGKRIGDPSAARFIEEFGGDRTSAFAVPGALWTTTRAPAGAITRHHYASAAIGGEEEYYVYTPPGYDARAAPTYPTLYLLHGMADNAHTWITNGGVNVTLDNLIAQRRAVPMLVVMPLGYGGAGDALLELVPFERALLEEVIPQVERTYRVSPDRAARAIAGVSMGGSQALAIAGHDAEMFAWVGAMSGDLQAELPRLSGGPHEFALIYLGWGARDPLAPRSVQLADRLKAGNVAVTTTETPDLGHVWTLWRQLAADLLQRLFTSEAR